MAGRYELTGGTHTWPDGSRVRRGESFNPTPEEREKYFEGRLRMTARVFVMPDTSHIDWSEGRDE